MNALAKIALAKAAETLAKGQVLAVGVHPVDVTLQVHITGRIRKDADQDYTPTIAIPLKASLALALHYAGVTREKAKEILTRAMTEAIRLDEKGEEHIQGYLFDMDSAMQHVLDITAALPKKTRAGAVHPRLVMEVTEPVEVA